MNDSNGQRHTQHQSHHSIILRTNARTPGTVRTNVHSILLACKWISFSSTLLLIATKFCCANFGGLAFATRTRLQARARDINTTYKVDGNLNSWTAISNYHWFNYPLPFNSFQSDDTTKRISTKTHNNGRRIFDACIICILLPLRRRLLRHTQENGFHRQFWSVCCWIGGEHVVNI